MVSIAQVEEPQIDAVLNNLIHLVDNIVTPEPDELKALLRNGKGKLLEMKNGEGEIVAHFFVTFEADTLVLECMLGQSKGGVDPCKALIEYGEKVCEVRGLKKLRINTKRGGVVKRFLSLGFDFRYFAIEKEII